MTPRSRDFVVPEMRRCESIDGENEEHEETSTGQFLR